MASCLGCHLLAERGQCVCVVCVLDRVEPELLLVQKLVDQQALLVLVSLVVAHRLHRLLLLHFELYLLSPSL